MQTLLNWRLKTLTMLRKAAVKMQWVSLRGHCFSFFQKSAKAILKGIRKTALNSLQTQAKYCILKEKKLRIISMVFIQNLLEMTNTHSRGPHLRSSEFARFKTPFSISNLTKPSKI